jgi:hypothetical protein
MGYTLFFLGTWLAWAVPLASVTYSPQPAFHGLVALVENSKKQKSSDEVSEGNAQLIQIVKGFLLLLSRGGVHQAYYGHTSKEFQETTTLNQFQVFVDSFASLARYRDAEIIQAEHFDRLATVVVDAHSVDQQRNLISVDMIFESGRWRILGIQVHPGVPPEKK